MVRTLFMRSGVLYVVPLALALEIPTLLESRRALGHNWYSTMEVANGSASLLLILAAVAASTVALGWSRHHVMLAALPGRSSFYWVLPVALLWAALSSTHLLWVGFVCLTTSPGTAGELDLLPLVPVMLALLAGCALGALAGYVAKSWLVAPFLGVLLYIALITWSGGSAGNLLVLGGVGVAIKGLHLRPELAYAQAVWFAVLALGAGAAAVSLFRRPKLLAGTTVIATGASALAATALIGLGPARFELGEVDWTCRGVEPRLCVLSQEAEALSSLQPRLAEAHERWMDVSSSESPPVYWQRLDASVPGHAAEVSLAVGMSDLELMLAVMAASSGCSDDWTYEQYVAAERLAGALVADGLASGSGPDARGVAEEAAVVEC